MSCWMKGWTRKGTEFQNLSYTFTTTFVQIFPRDPLRYAITIPSNATTTLVFAFSEAIPATAMWQIASTAAWLSLTEDDIGELITLPFWAKATAAGPVQLMTTMSYNARRKGEYDEYIRKQLSRAGSPEPLSRG